MRVPPPPHSTTNMGQPPPQAPTTTALHYRPPSPNPSSWHRSKALQSPQTPFRPHVPRFAGLKSMCPGLTFLRQRQSCHSPRAVSPFYSIHCTPPPPVLSPCCAPQYTAHEQRTLCCGPGLPHPQAPGGRRCQTGHVLRRSCVHHHKACTAHSTYLARQGHRVGLAALWPSGLGRCCSPHISHDVDTLSILRPLSWASGPDWVGHSHTRSSCPVECWTGECWAVGRTPCIHTAFPKRRHARAAQAGAKLPGNEPTM